MSFLNFLSGVFKPLAQLVDDVHTSEEEKLNIKQKLAELETRVTMEVLSYEKSLMESRTKVITSEAQSDSWLTKSWRPITMLTFLCLVVFDSFGWLANPLSVEAWGLLKIGLGGYVIGRSAQGVAKSVSGVLQKKSDHYNG